MLAIVGGKGGCGKTTTALGVARALADSGRRPLVTDADCDMPNLHTAAETDRRPGLRAVDDGAAFGRSIHRSDAFPGVGVVPAGRETGPVGQTALRRLARRSRTVLLDCPAGASDAVAAPLRAADGAVVVSTDRRASLDDAAKTVRMAESLGTRVVGGVVTRVGEGGSPPRTDGGPLGDRCPILATVPEISGAVLRSRAGRLAYERAADALRSRNV